MWGTGERKWLFADTDNYNDRAKAEQLLAGRLIFVKAIADKALWTDRPLPAAAGVPDRTKPAARVGP